MFKTISKALLFLIFPSLLYAQHYSTDKEIAVISKDIIDDLKYEGFDDEIVIMDFTGPSGQPTELGAYLASKVTEDLLETRVRFDVIDRSAIQGGGGGIDWSGILNDASRHAEKWLSEEHSETAKYMADVSKSLFNPSSNDQRLRGIKAIMRGKITTVGDHYELTLRVMKRKKGSVIAHASGPISNTSSLSKLHGSMLTQGPRVVSDPGPLSSPLGNQRVTRQHFVFELVKCFESGGVIEVHLRVTSQRQDSDIQLQANRITIFNQENSNEYQPIRVNIADQTNAWRVNKQLQEDSPVLSIISFKPPEDIEMISKLSVSAYSSQIQNFTIEMKDIFVQ
jgi:hypothetical protein